MKRQPTEWKKIFVNDISDKELIPNIYKEFIQLSIIKTNNVIKKCAEDLNRHFPKKTYRWPKACEKMLNITNLQENENQNYNKISPTTC